MTDLKKLKSDIKKWSVELGFDQMGVSGIEVKSDEEKLIQWLKNNHHGSMKYMEKHGKKRVTGGPLVHKTTELSSRKPPLLLSSGTDSHPNSHPILI